MLLFSEDHSTLDVSTITKSLNIPASTVYRYLKTFKEEGLIEEDSQPGLYRLGVKVVELAQVARKQMGIIDLSLPTMESLSARTRETIVLAGIRGHRAVCIERIEGRQNLRVSYERGSSQYLHAGASAKVIMAYLNPVEKRSILNEIGLPELTENTITEPQKLEAEFEKIKEDGFAISDGEVDPGVRAIAAPIFDENDKVIGSISIVGPTERIKGTNERRGIRLIIKAGKEITQKVIKYGI